MNLYSYCHNDSINAWDPSGHKLSLTSESSLYNREWLKKQLQNLTGHYVIGKDNNIKLGKKIKGMRNKQFGYQLVNDIANSNKNCSLRVSIKGKSYINEFDKTDIRSINVSRTELLDHETMRQFYKYGRYRDHLIDALNQANTIGHDAYVQLDNPSSSSNVYVIKANANSVSTDHSKWISKSMPIYIFLGHELIHAYAYMTGKSYIDKSTTPNILINNQLFSTGDCEYDIEELATVGLAYGYNRSITENDLRKENGLGLRISYDSLPIIDDLNNNKFKNKQFKKDLVKYLSNRGVFGYSNGW